MAGGAGCEGGGLGGRDAEEGAMADEGQAGSGERCMLHVGGAGVRGGVVGGGGEEEGVGARRSEVRAKQGVVGAAVCSQGGRGWKGQQHKIP